MYQKRRLRFMEKLPDNSIALFFSGKAPYKVGDEKYPFSVDKEKVALYDRHILIITRRRSKRSSC